jgi:heme exporter protein A
MTSPLAAARDASAHPPLLEARSIHLWRGDRHLLRGVDFEVRSGELLQVVGPNGIGKSSLLRILCNLLPAESGEVLWKGSSVLRQQSEFSQSLAYLAHLNALKNDLTAIENLRFSLALRNSCTKDKILSAMNALGLQACQELPIRSLSAGQKRRLALARVSLSGATLWILDEPTTNLDTAGVAVVESLMRQHLDDGGAIIAAAHQRLLADHPRTRTLELH